MGKDSIKEYFKGKTIFLTGGTGFVGKVLIEKLLRSCPDLDKIYVLIRPKKGKTSYERLERITSSSLFNKLRENYPENIKKIIPLDGDTTQPNLGLSHENRQLLVNEVQIFFHAAASVKFDDFLKDSIYINLRGAKESALLALEMKKIEVFMHVSTTYCNIDNRKVVEPILYPPHGDWKDVLMIAEKCDTEILSVLAQKFMGEEFVNTYIYTKQLAEHCINDLLLGKVPAIIFRPSVVVSTVVEPFPGWIDNFNGPVGLLMAGGSGILRIVYGDVDVLGDCIPVDNTVKAMIVAVWRKTQLGNINDLDIYNGSKYDQAPYKIGMAVEYGKRLYWDVPFSRKLWFPRNAMTKCWYNYFINVMLFHMIPACFIDLLLGVAGFKPILFKIQRKIYIANMAIAHFMLNEWYFVNTNTMAMLDLIPKKEMEDFRYDIMPVTDDDLYDYYLTSCDQARQILFKEDKEITTKTRNVTLGMYYLDRVCWFTFYAVAFWLIFIKVNILAVIWKYITTYWINL